MNEQRVVVSVPVLNGEMKMLLSLRAASVVTSVAAAGKLKIRDLAACWPESNRDKTIEMMIAKINRVMASRRVGSRIQLNYATGSYQPHQSGQVISWQKRNPAAGPPVSLSFVKGPCTHRAKSRTGTLQGFVPTV